MTSIKSHVRVTDEMREKKRTQNIAMASLENLNKCLELQPNKKILAGYLGVTNNTINYWKNKGTMSKTASIACLAFYYQNRKQEETSTITNLHVQISSDNEETVTKIIESLGGQWVKFTLE